MVPPPPPYTEILVGCSSVGKGKFCSGILSCCSAMSVFFVGGAFILSDNEGCDVNVFKHSIIPLISKILAHTASASSISLSIYSTLHNDKITSSMPRNNFSFSSSKLFKIFKRERFNVVISGFSTIASASCIHFVVTPRCPLLFAFELICNEVFHVDATGGALIGRTPQKFCQLTAIIL